jgi:hypothetical protein
MNFSSIFGFAELFDNNNNNNSYFYISDRDLNSIVIFNEKWEFQSFKYIKRPVFIVPVDKQLIITSDSYIYQTDSDLNILNSYFLNSAGYRGIFYDKASDSLHAAGFYLNRIDIFDRNLTFIDSVNTTYSPFSVYGHGGKMFVGTVNGKILIIQNRTITKSYSGLCGGGYVLSILVDYFSYMAFTCHDGAVYTYHTNGSFIFSYIFGKGRLFIKIDFNGHLIVNSLDQTKIYY